MKKLTVHYAGWGEDWPLGQLADDGRVLLFEYSERALTEGLELSPMHLKLGQKSYGDFSPDNNRLPGLINDSLPDGWGMLLMDRWFRKQGLPTPGPLDRLAFLADRAMGALRFEPALDVDTTQPDWKLKTIARETMRVLEGESTSALLELLITGGSPQGARPKALVQYDCASGSVSTRPDAIGAPWLVKFPGNEDHKEVCAVEQLYMELARECGLDVPESKLFDLSSKYAAFGVARFDRDKGMRVPVHSLAGLLHVGFRIPGSVDYTGLLRATRFLTRDEREVRKAYAHAVFNVVFHNRDDHPKNFAWRLGQDRRWRLAPGFDLTFSDGPGGQHHTDICGEARSVRHEHLLRLARDGGLELLAAEQEIDRICMVAASFSKKAGEFPIRRASLQAMKAAIEACSRAARK